MKKSLTPGVLKTELRQLEHHVYIHKSQVSAAEAWCRQQFGRRWDLIENRNGSWSMFWGGREHWEEYRFSFARHEDAVLFVLRWS